MKENFSTFICHIRVFFLFLIINSTKLYAQCDDNCPPIPLPVMYVHGDMEYHRVTTFQSAYNGIWQFSDPRGIYFTYDLAALNNMVSSFNLHFFHSYDSVSIYFGACEPTEFPEIPGALITTKRGAIISEFKLVLLFNPVENRKKSPNFFTLNTTNPNGFSVMADAKKLLDKFSQKPSLNITSSLDENDKYNHLTRDISKPALSNTIYMSYRFSYWGDFFIAEVDYQATKCRNQNIITGVKAFFTCYDKDGDGLNQNRTGIAERVNRLHLIFRLLNKDGNELEIDTTSDYKCRKRVIESDSAIVNTAIHNLNQIDTTTEILQKNTEKLNKQNLDTLSLYISNLKRLSPDNIVLKMEDLYYDIEKNRKNSQVNLTKLLRLTQQLKLTIPPSPSPTPPPGGGGDNGQLWP